MLSAGRISDALVAKIENRDVALWIRSFRGMRTDRASLVRFLSLPWNLVICEDYDHQLFVDLQASDGLDEAMVQRRGLVQILDRDPSRIELPPRCLPFFLLNGKDPGQDQGSFDGRLRRLTMLEHLRRTPIREILVLSFDENTIPADLSELWSSGFKCFLTIVSPVETAKEATMAWTKRNQAITTLVSAEIDTVLADLINRYQTTFPDQRRIVRIRDFHGNFQRLDVTALDEPERPILGHYVVIEERDLHLLSPSELNKQELINFFQDSTSSWRPYAAGLPWSREQDARVGLRNYMKRLDTEGSEENKILYVVSESGAGGTTLVHSLAFACAREGYPVLLAKQIPFVLDPLPVSNFLTRVHSSVERSRSNVNAGVTADLGGSPNSGVRLYETPWLIVFDTIHSEYRESELLQFRRDLEKAGRPTCLLVVIGPQPVHPRRALQP